MTKNELINALNVVSNDAELSIKFTTDWGNSYYGNVSSVTLNIMNNGFEAVINADEPVAKEDVKAA